MAFYMTLAEASDLIGMSTTHVLKLLKAGAIPYRKPGKRYMIAKPDIEAYMRRLPVNGEKLIHEAWLTTTGGGMELKVHMPPKNPNPRAAQNRRTPLMEFVNAVFVRAEEDYGWLEEQLEWLARHERVKSREGALIAARAIAKAGMNSQ